MFCLFFFLFNCGRLDLYISIKAVKTSPAGIKGRWLRHLLGGGRIRVDGLMTSHCGACHATIKSLKPSGLNCGAWEGQVESRRSPCQCSCLVSSCGFPCAHIKGLLVAVWSLHSPLSKLLRSMFYPSSDSNCWYLKSELISFFSPSAHLGYLSGREFFSWMQGRKGNVCVCGGVE